MIAGKDHALDAMTFRGAMLKGNTQAEVQSGSMFPKSKAAKQASIETILNLMFQYQADQPMNKRMMAKIFDDLEAGAIGKAFGDIDKDEGQINRENQQLAQGVPLQINAFDNHQAHIEGHTEFQKGATYLQLGPLVAQIMEMHVNEHREQLMLAQAPMISPPGEEQPPPPPESKPTGGASK